MTVLRIYRGLPGSGKTTAAKEWVSEDVSTRARVNRDDIREQLHDGEFIKGVTEKAVLSVRDASISVLLKRGVSVACDDTNLPNRTVRDLWKVAEVAKAEFEVVDVTDVPVDVCIQRDLDRYDRSVGRDIIEDMHTRFIKGKPHPLPYQLDFSDPLEIVPYVIDSSKRSAYVVDIDGTVALHGTRSPFDESRVHEDRSNEAVVSVIKQLHSAGHYIIFLSGRTDNCEVATSKWLSENVIEKIDDFSLYMRRASDNRKDSIVKLELFNKYIRNYYSVQGVFDDRNQVVEMWRALGLTCFQVAEGNF